MDNDNQHAKPSSQPPALADTKVDGKPGQGNGQQGTGGIASGQATSTPSQYGGQPHLGSQAGHSRAPGGTGENEGANEARAESPDGPDELNAPDTGKP